ncbi:MAG: OmpA family protein [Cyclobacteriaceae bacterium]
MLDMKNKKRWVGWLLVLISFQSLAQLNPYNYRLGAGIGYSNYYGDLSPYRIREAVDFKNLFRTFEFNPNYIQEKSFAISFEKRLSASVGIMMQAGQYDISMSDRYMDKNNQLERNLPNFNRALNFNTIIQDLGLALIFRTDNDRILHKNAFLAPYLSLGIGWLGFSVKGDLLNENGNIYDYTQEGTVNNYSFETNLSQLNTELDEGYDAHAFYAGLGLGLRFRLGKQVELFIQSDVRGTTTDYLDDVSGNYRDSYDNEFQRYAAQPGTNLVDPSQPMRGDPHLGNDWYLLHQAGLKFSIVPSRAAFRANKVSPYYEGFVFQDKLEEPLPKNEMTESDADSISKTTAPSGSPQYFTFIQINNDRTSNNGMDRKLDIIDGELRLMGKRQAVRQSEGHLGTLNQKIDSLNLLEVTPRSNLEDPEDLQNDMLKAARQSLFIQRDSTLQQINLLKSEEDIQKIKLDSLRSLPFEDYERYGRLDSLSFLKGLEQLPDALEKGLNQNNTWQPLGYSTEANRMAGQRSLEPMPDTQNTQDQEGKFPGSQQTYFSYPNPQGYNTERRDYPQTQQYPSYEPSPSSGNLSNPQYYQNYNLPPPDSRSNPRNQYFTPIYIPQRQARSGEAVPPNQSIQGYQPMPRETGQDSSSITGYPPVPGRPGIRTQNLLPNFQDENGQRFLKDSAFHWGKADLEGNPLNYFTLTDTVLLEKEIRIGLNNSKTEVFFEINKSELSEEEKVNLVPIANLLSENPGYSVVLSGFADNTGNINYNLNLIEKRTNHIKDLLTGEFGIVEDRIKINPGGLLVRGSSKAQRFEDRKVEITVRDENGNENID